ncbi:MAG: hypothetical protein IJZ35_08670 [Clostridia bacterium]|nr:hypothetical protein [Clostridia bacterium]
MKKFISVLLAVILAFSVLAVSVAAGSEYQTYYVENITTDENITIVPANGYDWYVMPGEEFKFYIEVAEDYSDTFVLVEVDMVVVEPDVHGIYTIPDMQKDVTVKAYLSMETEQSNLFASLIVFLRSILDWFMNLFNGLM